MPAESSVFNRRNKKLGLGVISFTGRKYEEVSDLLAGIDLVLDGAYVLEEKETKRRLLGSENQRILCLTDRYKMIFLGSI